MQFKRRDLRVSSRRRYSRANPKSKIALKIALRAGRCIRLAGSECGKREGVTSVAPAAVDGTKSRAVPRVAAPGERAPGDQCVSADPGAESRNGNLVFRKSRKDVSDEDVCFLYKSSCS